MVVLSSFILPESPIRHEQRNVQAILDKKDLGVGTLYISESTVCWQEQNGQGFSLQYPHISLHAISKDVTVHPKECIYILIDAHVNYPGAAAEESPTIDGDSDAESEADVSELVLVPEDGSVLTRIYETLNECQALNPDPEDMEEDEDNIFEDAEEGLEMESFTNNGIIDIGGGGDMEINHITNRLHDSIAISYDYSNGDQENDEHFEDAD